MCYLTPVLPILCLQPAGGAIRALVLAPTREQGSQLDNNFDTSCMFVASVASLQPVGGGVLTSAAGRGATR
jgi:superfamily II DNA/RNA helicase